jgi:hypothetical protein
MEPVIEIIPLELSKDIFNDYEYVMRDLQDNENCFITNLNVICALIARDEYPIKNKRIAIKSILSFLNYLDGLHRKENDTLIPISQKVLIEYFSKNEYVKYMNLLKEMNIITCVPYEDGSMYKMPNYEDRNSKGKRVRIKDDNGKNNSGIPKQYRLYNDYINNKDLCIVLIDGKNKKLELECDLDLDKRFKNTILKMDLNFKEVIISEIINAKENNLTQNELRKRLASAFSTKHRRFIKKGTKVDRIYHSFSNITRIAREHLNIKFLSIDVCNCQPALLIHYLISNGFQVDKNYIEVCEAGKFYEAFLSEEDKDNKEKRDEIKVKLYNSVFFGFYADSKTNQKFKELFPIVWNTINNLHNSNISLVSRLNNIEADLFNNLVPQKSKNFFTLFDSIYFSSLEDYSQLNNQIKDYFKKININIQTK